MKRLLISLLTYGLWISVAAAGGYAVADEQLMTEVADQKRELEAFQGIEVKGNIHLTVVDGAAEYAVELPSDSARRVTTRVSENTLFMRYNRKEMIPVVVYLPHLHHIYYEGEGSVAADRLNTGLLNVSVTDASSLKLAGQINLASLVLDNVGQVEIRGINSNYLDLIVSGSSDVKLHGAIALRNVSVSGNSQVEINEVKSRHLILQGDKRSYIALFGIANLLEVTLSDDAHFNGLELRVDDAYVKTFDDSVASILVTDLQNTVANDNSNIYYYQRPEFAANFMEENGSVLFIDSKARRAHQTTGMIVK